jgi:hypothetical protein
MSLALSLGATYRSLDASYNIRLLLRSKFRCAVEFVTSSAGYALLLPLSLNPARSLVARGDRTTALSRRRQRRIPDALSDRFGQRSAVLGALPGGQRGRALDHAGSGLVG